jgi:hypothetical protein
MPTLCILFHDGEIMYASSPPLRFDLPVIEAEVMDLDSNSERAILPLAGIRQIIVGEVSTAPPPGEMESWDRAAFHFIDGQVLRAWVGPEAALGVHGGIWPIVEPGSDELRTLAIPYSSLKGIFRLRSWDTRTGGGGGDAHGLQQTVRILAEREVRSFGQRERRGATLLDRLRADGLERTLAGTPDPALEEAVDTSEHRGDA